MKLIILTAVKMKMLKINNAVYINKQKAIA